jgi:hypothetical protein
MTTRRSRPIKPALRQTRTALRRRSRRQHHLRSHRQRQGLVLVLLITAIGAVVQGPIRRELRIREAWQRIGTCTAVAPDSPQVVCDGVTLVPLTLPLSFPACDEIKPLRGGECVVDVNQEALPDFRAAVAEVDSSGLGKHVLSFGTVNRRRCRNARSGKYVEGCVSKHSYGIAVDFRPFADNARWDVVVRNEPGVSEIVSIFQRYGFRWGMEFSSNPDPQHLEWHPR